MKIRWKQSVMAAALASALVFPAGGAFAADSQAVTRGEFVRMVAQQLQLSPSDKEAALPKDVKRDSVYADAVRALIERKVLEGYDDGTFRLDQAITDREASYIVGRFLGLDESGALDRLQSRFNAPSDEDGMLSGAMAQKLVQAALKSDESAVQFLKTTAAKQADVDSFRANMTIDMKLGMRAMEGQPAATVGSQVYSVLEFRKDQGLHQHSEVTVQAPTGPVKVTMNQYTVTQGTYMEMNDPNLGKAVWYDLTAQMPSFAQLMALQQANADIADKWLLPEFFYRDLGEVTEGGANLRKIEIDGKVADVQKLLGMFGTAADNSNLFKMVEQSPLLAGMSVGVSGVFTFDESTLRLVRMDATYGIRYKGSEFLPLDSIDATMKAEYKDYNAAIEVKLPDEAKQAVPMPMVPAAGSAAGDAAGASGAADDTGMAGAAGEAPQP